MLHFNSKVSTIWKYIGSLLSITLLIEIIWRKLVNFLKQLAFISFEKNVQFLNQTSDTAVRRYLGGCQNKTPRRLFYVLICDDKRGDLQPILTTVKITDIPRAPKLYKVEKSSFDTPVSSNGISRAYNDSNVHRQKGLTVLEHLVGQLGDLIVRDPCSDCGYSIVYPDNLMDEKCSKAVQSGEGFESLRDYDVALNFAKTHGYGSVEFIEASSVTKPAPKEKKWKPPHFKGGGHFDNKSYCPHYSLAQDHGRVRYRSGPNKVVKTRHKCSPADERRNYEMGLQRTASFSTPYQEGTEKAYMFRLAEEIRLMQLELDESEENIRNRKMREDSVHREKPRKSRKFKRIRRKCASVQTSPIQPTISRKKPKSSSCSVISTRTKRVGKGKLSEKTSCSSEVFENEEKSSVRCSSSSLNYNNGSVVSSGRNSRGRIQHTGIDNQTDKSDTLVVECALVEAEKEENDESSDVVNNESSEDYDYEGTDSETYKGPLVDKATQTDSCSNTNLLDPVVTSLSNGKTIPQLDDSHYGSKGASDPDGLINTQIDRVRYVGSAENDNITRMKSEQREETQADITTEQQVKPKVVSSFPRMSNKKTLDVAISERNNYSNDYSCPVRTFMKSKNEKRFTSRTIVSRDSRVLIPELNVDTDIQCGDSNTLMKDSKGLVRLVNTSAGRTIGERAQGDVLQYYQQWQPLQLIPRKRMQSQKTSKMAEPEMGHTRRKPYLPSPSVESGDSSTLEMQRQNECGNNSNQFQCGHDFSNVFNASVLGHRELTAARIIKHVYKHRDPSMIKSAKLSIDAHCFSRNKPYIGSHHFPHGLILRNTDNNEQSGTDKEPQGEINAQDNTFSYKLVVHTFSNVFEMEAKQDTFHAIIGMEAPPITRRTGVINRLEALILDENSNFSHEDLIIEEMSDEDQNTDSNKNNNNTVEEDGFDGQSAFSHLPNDPTYMNDNNSALDQQNNDSNLDRDTEDNNGIDNSKISQTTSHHMQESNNTWSDTNGSAVSKPKDSKRGTKLEDIRSIGELENELIQLVSEQGEQLQDGLSPTIFSGHGIQAESTCNRNSSKIIQRETRKSPPRVTFTRIPVKHVLYDQVHGKVESIDGNQQNNGGFGKTHYPPINLHQRGMVYAPTTENYWCPDDTIQQSTMCSQETQNHLTSQNTGGVSAFSIHNPVGAGIATSNLDCYKMIDSCITESENKIAERLNNISTILNDRLDSLETMVKRRLNETVSQFGRRAKVENESNSDGESQSGSNRITYASRPNLASSTGFYPTYQRSEDGCLISGRSFPPTTFRDTTPNNNYFNVPGGSGIHLKSTSLQQKRVGNMRRKRTNRVHRQNVKRRSRANSSTRTRKRGVGRPILYRDKRPRLNTKKRRRKLQHRIPEIANAKRCVSRVTYRRNDHTRRCRLRRHKDGEDMCNLSLVEFAGGLKNKRYQSKPAKRGKVIVSQKSQRRQPPKQRGLKRNRHKSNPEENSTIHLDKGHLNTSNCAMKRYPTRSACKQKETNVVEPCNKIDELDDEQRYLLTYKGYRFIGSRPKTNSLRRSAAKEIKYKNRSVQTVNSPMFKQPVRRTTGRKPIKSSQNLKPTGRCISQKGGTSFRKTKKLCSKIMNKKYLNVSNCASKKQSKKRRQGKPQKSRRNNIDRLCTDKQQYVLTNKGYKKMTSRLMKRNEYLANQLKGNRKHNALLGHSIEDIRKQIVERFNGLLKNSSDERVNNFYRILFPIRCTNMTSNKASRNSLTQNNSTDPSSHMVYCDGSFVRHVNSMELIRQRLNSQNNRKRSGDADGDLIAEGLQSVSQSETNVSASNYSVLRQDTNFSHKNGGGEEGRKKMPLDIYINKIQTPARPTTQLQQLNARSEFSSRFQQTSRDSCEAHDYESLDLRLQNSVASVARDSMSAIEQYRVKSSKQMSSVGSDTDVKNETPKKDNNENQNENTKSNIGYQNENLSFLWRSPLLPTSSRETSNNENTSENTENNNCRTSPIPQNFINEFRLSDYVIAPTLILRHKDTTHENKNNMDESSPLDSQLLSNDRISSNDNCSSTISNPLDDVNVSHCTHNECLGVPLTINHNSSTSRQISQHNSKKIKTFTENNNHPFTGVALKYQDDDKEPKDTNKIIDIYNRDKLQNESFQTPQDRGLFTEEELCVNRLNLNVCVRYRSFCGLSNRYTRELAELGEAANEISKDTERMDISESSCSETSPITVDNVGGGNGLQTSLNTSTYLPSTSKRDQPMKCEDVETSDSDNENEKPPAWLTTTPYLSVRTPGLSTRWTISTTQNPNEPSQNVSSFGETSNLQVGSIFNPPSNGSSTSTHRRGFASPAAISYQHLTQNNCINKSQSIDGPSSSHCTSRLLPSNGTNNNNAVVFKSRTAIFSTDSQSSPKDLNVSTASSVLENRCQNCYRIRKSNSLPNQITDDSKGVTFLENFTRKRKRALDDGNVGEDILRKKRRFIFTSRSSCTQKIGDRNVYKEYIRRFRRELLREKFYKAKKLERESRNLRRKSKLRHNSAYYVRWYSPPSDADSESGL